jgi:dynamin 1-like protein
LSELQGNGLFPLRLGYVAVLNRSQEDIDAGIDIVEARRKENNFFAKHPIYGLV